MLTPAQLAHARHELLKEGARGIETKTALAWLARAICAYDLACEKHCVRWLHEAAGYAGEALEHAGNVEDQGSLVAAVEACLAPAREAAIRGCGG
jgi:hypothetical protein